MLVVNIAIQLYDGLATLIGIHHGVPEGNPIVRSAMLHVGDTGGLVLTKLCAIALLAVLYQWRAHRWVAPGMACVAVVYALMAVLPWTVLLAITPG